MISLKLFTAGSSGSFRTGAVKVRFSAWPRWVSVGTDVNESGGSRNGLSTGGSRGGSVSGGGSRGGGSPRGPRRGRGGVGGRCGARASEEGRTPPPQGA